MRHFLIICFFAALNIYAQISPGDLTKAHAKLEGISNCTSCHEIGEKVKNSNCLGCHSEIAELIKSSRGYHSSSDVKGKNCSDCHSEHHGRNFRIVNFNPDKFDHSKTTFQLTGKHSSIKCSGCHTSKNIVNPEAKKKNLKWVGLNSLCTSCHSDYHLGTLGTTCEGCHNTEKFRPSTFDHDKSKFTLTGSHKNTSCIKCHPKEQKEGKEFQRFKGIQFTTCENCHKDVHHGKFGKNCSSCHSTDSFKSINQRNFEHSKTGFPLLGKHISVSCSQCHKGPLTEKIPHKYCTDCHKDYHNGELVYSNNSDRVSKDCRECHTENGFSPSLYTLEQHNKSKFPIAGSHLAVPCAGCHLKEKRWSFRNIGTECADCHKNIHNDEIDIKYLEFGGCGNCHSIKSWETIAFDHNKTDFMLAGRHTKLNCRNCHIPDNDLSRQKFKSLSNHCSECHEDVHAGQFGKGTSEECSRCHTFDNWKPEKFDHNKTRFSLEGAHSKLKCTECHKPVVSENKTYLKYKLEDFKCAYCHS